MSRPRLGLQAIRRIGAAAKRRISRVGDSPIGVGLVAFTAHAERRIRRVQDGPVRVALRPLLLELGARACTDVERAPECGTAAVAVLVQILRNASAHNPARRGRHVPQPARAAQ
jgi:hypothetical protein